MVIDSPWLRLYIVLEYSRSPSTQDDYSSYIWCQQHTCTGTVLMDYLLVGVNIDRQAVWCVHYWHCVFIRCVGGYIIVYMSYHDTAIVGFFFPTNFFFSQMFLGFWNLFFGGGGGILGCLGRPTPPPGGRAGSENNTLLPMTMICDRLKFWSGPAWRSKVIIRKPWRRKNKKKKKKKKKKSDKTIRHSRREAGNA